jgi:hypothetical protein
MMSWVKDHWGFLLVALVAAVILGIGSVFWFAWPPVLLGNWKPTATDQVGIATATSSFVVGWFAITAAWYARRQADATNKSSEVAQEEARQKTRPWIGLASLELIEDPDRSVELLAPGVRPRRRQDKIRIVYNNVGALPATTCTEHLRLTSTVENGTPTELLNTKRLMGSVFPGEKNTFEMDPLDFFNWRNKNMEVVLKGHLEYFLGTVPYKTKFKGKFTFVKGQKPLTSWNNIEAT